MDDFLPLSTADRTAIASDIAAWKEELHMNDNNFTIDEYDDYVADLRDLSDEELLDFWEGNVGDWILSREDVHRAHGESSGDKIINRELRLLLTPDVHTSYGYLSGRPQVTAGR